MNISATPARDHFFSQSCTQCNSAPFLRYFRKCKSPQLEKQMRTIVPNHAVHVNINDRHHPNHSYRTNRIRTTKYTVLSFLPKNIFEQFHRFANLYFLGIVVLNWIIKAFGREVSIIPLGFVLGVTAVKDAFEDWRRYRSDKRVNSYTCRVYKREAGRYVKAQWKNVRVGDIVHLSCNEIIPADILLLRSSDIQGLCYIETANIDGETNLKQRQVARGATPKHSSFHPTDFNKSIECDPPNNKIYKFHGCILTPGGERMLITKENLLLRDCVLKNTDFIEGIVLYAGHETKAMLNNGGPRYKRSKLEKIMNTHILGCIAILVLLCLIGALGCGLWVWMYGKSQSVPFVPNEDVPDSPLHQGAYSILTFIIILQVIIPLSLYVTVEIIKLGQVFFIHEDLELYDETSNKRVECRALNIPEELGQVQYIFSDKTGTLTENCMIFRQCTVGGVDYNHLSSNKGDQSNDVTAEAKDLKDAFIVNPRLYEELCLMDMELHVDKDIRLQLSSDHKRIQDFFLLLAICNTVVVSKHPHKDQMNSSGLFLNLLSANNELHIPGAGDVPHDKYIRLINSVDTPSNSAASTPNWRPRHLALPTFGAYCNSTPTPSPADFRPIYEAESPDEIALVEAAFQYNCRLLKRTPETALIVLPGEGMIEFKVLHILPFDAVRKRMSIILQHPFTDEKILFCKGADSTVLTQISTNATYEMQEIIMKTQQQLNGYSKKGLRILCMAKKVISPDEYETWLAQHKEAELTFEDQDELLHISACRIETNLELLGATGIEDRLQKGVPETIAALRSAGIVLWVLTGDKQETAVNIAYSCKLFSSNMEIITINARSVEATEDTIKFYLDQINKDLTTWNSSPSPTTFSFLSLPVRKFLRKRSAKNNRLQRPPSHSCRQRAMVIDGHTLSYVLDKRLSPLFLELAVHCQSVLCCRATPLQKASIIKLVKETLHVLTLAIGDGANDVSMIQTADVGVGISGEEGMQAVMASDFALARFRYLERLLLVHGHWCYDRLARIILYFFYKNANLIFVIFWYQFFCGFTGAVMIDQLYLMLVNVFFTSLPPIVLGMYDQDVFDYLLLQNPRLYARGRNSELYTKYSFIFNMMDAVYQSIVMFFIPFAIYYDDTIGIWEFGTTAGTACVVTQLVHLCIEIKSWTWIHLISIFISLLLYFGFACAYSAICVTCPGLQNPYWVVEHTISTANFWFSMLLIIPLSCFPRLMVYAIKNQFWPSDVVNAKLEHRANKKYSEQSTLSVSWSRASSGSSIIINSGNQGDVQEESIQPDVSTISATLNSHPFHDSQHNTAII